MRGDEQEVFITDLIFAEVANAEKKHPFWPTDPLYMASIVAEESGELIRAAVQLKIDLEQKAERISEGEYNMEYTELRIQIRKEAIQTAAMCVRLLKNL